MVKFAQFVQEFSQKQKRERKKEMKRTLRQSTAILLAVLMVFSSVGMLLGFAVDGEPAAPVWPEGYRVVDGAAHEDWWAAPVEGKTDVSYAYRLTKDDTNLYFDFVTATANLKTGADVFRLWLHDDPAYNAYTDFVTVKESEGDYVLANANANTDANGSTTSPWDTSLTEQIVIEHEASGDNTAFKVTIPLAAFSGLENRQQIDAWVSLWPAVEDGTASTCLHSGSGGAPTVIYNGQPWNLEEDYTLVWATVDGAFDESFWSEDWVTVDGENVGQWQTSSTTPKEGFEYDYQVYFGTEYLYIGVKYNQAPSYIALTQTEASNIRIWYADLQTTPTGKFGALVDVRYDGEKAVVPVRDVAEDLMQIDESKVFVKDTKDENSWSVEVAIPLSELGLLGWDNDTYCALGITASDPFGTENDDLYGALHSWYGFNNNDRTTWEVFYPNGSKYPQYNGTPVLPEDSTAENIALEEGVTKSYPDGYENRTGQWPAWYIADLFDGVASDDTGGYNDNWYGFYENGDNPLNNMVNGIGTVTIDFGKVDTGVGAVRAHIMGGKDGIAMPESITAYASLDNVSWLKIGQLEYDASIVGATWAELILDEEIDAQYIRLDFKKGSGVFAFVNEIEVLHYTPVVKLEYAAAEGSTIEVPTGYGAIDVLLDGDKTEITGYEGNQSKIFALKNQTNVGGDDGKTPQGSMTYTLTRRFAKDTAISKITMSLLNYTAGNVGLPESVTVTINGEDYTAANVTNQDGAVNDYVVEFDIAEIADEFVITVVHPAGAVKYSMWTEIAVESDLVALPEGAIAIDNIGYKHAASVSIFGGDGTITEVAGKDNNYAKVITVNKFGFVTGTYFTLGDYSKGNVEIPEGGYVISYNANKAGNEAMDTIKVGDYIRLYNVDTSLFGNYSGQDDYDELVNAGFTVTSIGDGVTNLSDPNEIKIDATDKLTDGKYGEAAGAWGTGTDDVLLIQNLNPTDASINPTVRLLLKLDSKQAINTLKFGFYHDKNSMIGLPKDNQVRVSVSENGLDFTALDTYTLTSTAAVGSFGTEILSKSASNTEALYVMLEYEIGPSGFADKVVYEFTAMTEFYAGAFDAFVPVDDTVVVDDENKTILLDDETTAADLLAAFGDDSGELYSISDADGKAIAADALVGTGAVVTELVTGEEVAYTVIVRGDVNGDGRLTQTDYLMTKRAVLKIKALEGVYLEAAACFNGEDGLTGSDYLLMKRTILGLA